MTDVDVFHPVDDAALFDTLDEGVTSSVVRNRQAERILALGDFNFFGPSCNKPRDSSCNSLIDD